MGESADILMAIRRHPFITGFLVFCVLLGAGLGALYLPADWSSARKLAAGAFAGGGIGFIITASRMLGAWEPKNR